MKVENKEKLAAAALILGTFFLPFGFTSLFKITIDITGSYWMADKVFYVISGLFFLLYCYLTGTNPIKYFSNKLKSFIKKFNS